MLLMGFGLLVIVGAAWELAAFATAGTKRPSFFVCLVLAPLVTAYLLLSSGFCTGESARISAFAVMAGFSSAFFASLALLIVSAREELQGGRGVAADLFLGVGLVGFCGASLVAISALDHAPAVLFWLTLVVCTNDAAAYFTGVKVGGPKLAPGISPGKTLSGSAGGLAAGTFFGALFGPWCLGLDVSSAAALSFLVVLSAQAGDLGKSFLKRVHGVKDSGNLLPGHGGILDRVDGILAAGPMVLSWLLLL